MTKGTRFLKKLFQKTKFFMKFCPVRTSFETMISKFTSNDIPNLYTVGKKFWKWEYTTQNVGFLWTVVTDFPFYRDTSTSRNDSFPFFRWGTHLYMSLIPSVRSSICPSIHPSIRWSVCCLSVHLSVGLFVRRSVCPSVVHNISGTIHHLIIIFGTLM